MDDRNAPAKSLELLGSTTEQSASSCSQGFHDEIAIIAVQEKNETDVRMAGMQATQCIDQMDVIGGTVTDEYHIDLGRSQACRQLESSLRQQVTLRPGRRRSALLRSCACVWLESAKRTRMEGRLA